MKNIKILHTADLHLGYKFADEEIKTKDNDKTPRSMELNETFHDIINLAIKEKVEILLIAGDMFEDENPGKKLVNFVIKEFRRIPEIDIFIAPGNHDYYSEDCFYDDIINSCENVYVFDGEMDYFEMEYDEGLVRVFGAGFEDARMNDSLFRPKVVRRNLQEDIVGIGVIHGTVGNREGYNPIKLKDIEASGLDYLALGHIHKPEQIKKAGNTSYAYCGSPQALNFKETGVHGVYVGTVSKNSVNLRYVEIGKRSYYSYSMDLTSIDLLRIGRTPEKGLVRIILQKMKEDAGSEFEENLYRIVLKGEVKSKLRIKEIQDELMSVYCVNIIDNTQVKEEIKMEMVEDNTVRKRAVKETMTNNGDIANNSFIIKNINIKGFGGLKNFKLDFTDGYNCIYGENGFGKSTVMAFIMMMLYGTTTKSKDLHRNPRLKFRPLDGSAMAGSMTFEVNGKDYLVEKCFGKTRGEDTVSVVEVATSTKLNFPSDKEIGDYFLKVNKEEFENSLFGDEYKKEEQGDVVTGLFSKLTDMELKESGESVGGLKKLTTEIEKLKSKRGASGKIVDVTNDMEAKEDELRNLEKELEDVTGFSQDRLREGEDVEDYLDRAIDKYTLTYNIFRVLTILAFVAVLGISIYLFVKHGSSAAGYVIIGLVVIAICMFVTLISRIKIRSYEDYDYDVDLAAKLREDIDKVEEDIEAIRDERNELIARYNELVKQHKELKNKVTDARNDVWQPVSDRVTELVNKVWAKECSGIVLGEDGQVYYKLEDVGRYINWKYLSQGQAQMAYLCMRIAVCEKINDEGLKLPILLDNVLCSCDDRSRKAMINVFKELGIQVILFTSNK